MCIVLLDWQPDTATPLRMAANRDEFHARPAQAARWRGDVFCGVDLSAGGTWLGIHRQGRFAVVTNFREPITRQPGGERSRGMLPQAFLESDQSPETFCRDLQHEQHRYGGFNLLVGNSASLWYMGNRGAPPRPLSAGLHGLSNGLLDDPWPKVQRAKTNLQQAVGQGGSLDQLLSVVNDRYQPAEETLPDTGVGRELERLVAPVFIQSLQYGTRASSAVIVHADGTARMREQCWNPDGTAAGQPSDSHTG